MKTNSPFIYNFITQGGRGNQDTSAFSSEDDVWRFTVVIRGERNQLVDRVESWLRGMRKDSELDCLLMDMDYNGIEFHFAKDKPIEISEGYDKNADLVTQANWESLIVINLPFYSNLYSYEDGKWVTNKDGVRVTVERIDYWENGEMKSMFVEKDEQNL